MDSNELFEKTVNTIVLGNLAVIPTDTVLGIVAHAFNKKAVRKLYEVRKRNLKKPCIVLVPKVEYIFDKFDIDIFESNKKILQLLWNYNINTTQKYSELSKTSFKSILDKINLDRSITIVLTCDNEKFSYLHLNSNSIAFRVPSSRDKNGEFIMRILKKVEAVIAPSANLEGKKNASNIAEAKEYFGDKVECYVENIEFLNKDVSHVILLNNTNWKVLR